MKVGIGIDLGGTAIKGAIFDCDDGRELERASVPTCDGEPAVDGVPRFALQVRDLVAELGQKVDHDAVVVGLSAPGMTNASADRIEFIPNRLEGLQGFQWSEFLGGSVAVVNDAHAALLGEIWLGSARGLRDAILLTLGTGVGGAAVTGGKLLRGHLGRGGHLGHISLDYLGEGDICETPGSLEALVGNATVAERSGGRFTMTLDLVAAVENGDCEAIRIWDDSMRALGAGIASLVNVLDPQAVILGGGISTAWQTLEPSLRRWLDEFEWRPGGAQVEIRKAELGEWAGAYGALAFALDFVRGPM